jgi:dihydrofolate synthase/folylpolyglutamate synthase
MYYPDIPVIVVFGASEDKDIEGMLVELSPRVQELIAVQSFHPRAIDPGNLVEAAGRYGIPARIIVDIPEALEAGLRIAGEDKLILVTGSIFVVAASREFWMKRSEKIGTQR